MLDDLAAWVITSLVRVPSLTHEGLTHGGSAAEIERRADLIQEWRLILALEVVAYCPNR